MISCYDHIYRQMQIGVGGGLTIRLNIEEEESGKKLNHVQVY